MITESQTHEVSRRVLSSVVKVLDIKSGSEIGNEFGFMCQLQLNTAAAAFQYDENDIVVMRPY